MGQEQRKNVKRYYWLKLKEEFFLDKEVKKLRKIAGGDTYTIIYLKLMLLSLKTDGKLYFDGIEDTFAEELALEIDEDPENVQVTLMYLKKMSLLTLINEDEMYLTQMDNLIGSESESAERVRKHRAKIKEIEDNNKSLEMGKPTDNTESNGNFIEDKTLHCNDDVTECNADETNCNTYTDTYKDTKENKKKKYKRKKDGVKHRFGTYNHVVLTDAEYESLIEDYGEKGLLDGIKNVDDYCQMKGKKYSDYNLVLRNWGIKSPKLEQLPKTANTPKEEELTEEERIKQLEAEGVKWIT